MITTEQWIYRIASLSGLAEETCRTLWHETVKTITNRLSRNQDFVMAQVGCWHADTEDSRIVVLPSGDRYLLPPRMIPQILYCEHLENKDELLGFVKMLSDVIPQTAEDFCRAWVEVFTEYEEKGLSLHWSGLGTFEQKELNGERAYAFIPEEDFFHKINKPFELFSPTPIHADLSWKNIEEYFIESLEEAAKLPFSDRLKPNIQESVAPIEESKGENRAEEETPEAENTSEVSIELPLPEVRPEEPQALKSEAIAPIEEQQPEQPIAEGMPIPTDTRQEIASLTSDSQKKRRRAPLWIVVSIVLLLLVVFLAGLFLYLKRGANCKEEALPAHEDRAFSTLSSDSIQAPKAEVVADSLPDSLSLIPQKGLDQALENEDSARYIKVEPGKNLAYYARKYLGNSFFWVYIYRDNKATIQDPNNVPVGTSLRIPSLKELQIDPKQEGHLQKAKEMAYSIQTEKRSLLL